MSELALGRVTFTRGATGTSWRATKGKASHTYLCDAIAFHAERQGRYCSNTIMVLSVAGPQTAVKALGAWLRTNAKGVLQAKSIPSIGSYVDFDRHEAGYRVKKHRLGCDTWHMLALANDVRLMPKLDEQFLYQALKSTEYSTPILRQWTPWLMQQLLRTPVQQADARQNLLTKLDAWQCNPGLLLAETADLDKLVTLGLQQGTLQIAA